MAVKVFPSAYVVPLWVTVTVPPLGEPTVIVYVFFVGAPVIVIFAVPIVKVPPLDTVEAVPEAGVTVALNVLYPVSAEVVILSTAPFIT